MGNKVRVRARATRGAEADEALAGLSQILCQNYDTTKNEYDALETDWKVKFDIVLGDLSEPFNQGKLMVEMNMNLLEESEVKQKFEELNQLLDELEAEQNK